MEESALLFVQEHIRQGWLNRIVVFITKLGDVGFFWIALTLVLFCISQDAEDRDYVPYFDWNNSYCEQPYHKKSCWKG